MPRFSTYYADYSRLQTVPWDFWTDEERSYVIKHAYENLYLTAKDIQPYLTAVRGHFYSQWILPIGLTALYQLKLKNTVFNQFYRKSPTQGRFAGFMFLGVSTWLWLNFSPFYMKKQASQQKTLGLLYKKIGSSMILLNGFLPRTQTSTSIDKETMKIYLQRNGRFAGTIYPEEDKIPPILPVYKAATEWKKNTR